MRLSWQCTAWEQSVHNRGTVGGRLGRDCGLAKEMHALDPPLGLSAVDKEASSGARRNSNLAQAEHPVLLRWPSSTLSWQSLICSLLELKAPWWSQYSTVLGWAGGWGMNLEIRRNKLIAGILTENRAHEPVSKYYMLIFPKLFWGPQFRGHWSLYTRDGLLRGLYPLQVHSPCWIPKRVMSPTTSGRHAPLRKAATPRTGRVG